MTAAPIPIREPSVRSLLVGPRANAAELGTATGFVAAHGQERYLVTNWHVVAGRRPDNGAPLARTAAVPDNVAVVHNVAGQLGRWQARSERLYDDRGDPLWLEHPAYGRRVDIVALPLTETDGVQLLTYDPSQPGTLITFGPSDPVSIVGFPFGMTGGGALAIWAQGTVATEPSIDYQDLPCFLVDSRTRPGQSGSPVILYRPGGYTDERGNTMITTQAAERFIGVYSGRINEQSDLGFVWKAVALADILNGQTRGPVPSVGPPP